MPSPVLVSLEGSVPIELDTHEADADKGALASRQSRQRAPEQPSRGHTLTRGRMSRSRLLYEEL